MNAAAATTLSSGVSVSSHRSESTASTSLVKQTSATSSSSPSSTVLPASGTTSEPVSKAAIAGGVVGGSAAAVLVCLLLFFLRRRGREKQRRAATVLAPGYLPHEEDISAHGGAEVIGELKDQSQSANHSPPAQIRASVADSEATAVGLYDEKKARFSNVEEDPIPHLDGTPIRPTLEMMGSLANPLGRIPELSTLKDPSPDTAPLDDHSNSGSGEQSAKASAGDNPITQPSKGAATAPKTNLSTDDAPHVMSWTAYEDPRSRTSAARLSRPHTGPDMSLGVWSNMVSSQQNEDKSEEKTG